MKTKKRNKKPRTIKVTEKSVRLGSITITAKPEMEYQRGNTPDIPVSYIEIAKTPPEGCGVVPRVKNAKELRLIAQGVMIGMYHGKWEEYDRIRNAMQPLLSQMDMPR